MPTQRKRIALLFCGGTTLNQKDGPGDSVRTERDIPKWLANFAELTLIADVEPHFIYGGEAAGVGRREWAKIVEVVSKRQGQVDGFLITHGLDTLPYTANMLAFLIQGLNKPVVLTGSIVAGKTERSVIVESAFQHFKGMEAKANLVNAAQVAASDVGEVVVVFGNRVLRASRTIRATTPSANPFDTQDQSVLGKIDFGVRFAAHHPKRTSKKPQFTTAVDTKVTIVNWHPGVDMSMLRQSLGTTLHGVIIHMSESNYIPDDLYQLFRHAQEHGVAVVLYTATGPKRLKESEFILVDRMSLIATLTKLMWVLGKSRDLTKVRKYLQTPFANELLNS